MQRRTFVAVAVVTASLAFSGTAAAHPTTRSHAASCGNVCLLAEAFPGWICDVQSGVVAAGITIVGGAAALVWAALGNFVWTAQCHIVDDYILSNAQRNLLLSTGRNCWFAWSQPGRQGTRRIKCLSYYA